jgi:hypothetical protein
MLWLGRVHFIQVFLVAAAALEGALGSTWEARARADDSVRPADMDTTYGRIDGDLGVAFGVGATLGPSAPRGTLELRLRYLDTAGIFAEYEDSLGSDASNPRHLFGGGFEIRPLFLARWLAGRELGVPWLDLLIDSVGFELGAFYEQPVGEAVENRTGLQASLGLEVPILPRASGPWIGLHAGVRWSDATLEGESPPEPLNSSLFLAMTLAYHQIFPAHLVDAADIAPR